MVDVLNMNYITRRTHDLESYDIEDRIALAQNELQIVEMTAAHSLGVYTNLFLQSDNYSDDTGYKNTTHATGADTTATFDSNAPKRYKRASGSAGTEYIYIDFALTGTITDTMLLVRDSSGATSYREAGDNITYTVIGDSTQSDLVLATKNKNTAGTITHIKINLVSGTSATAGIPAILSYCLVVWKA